MIFAFVPAFAFSAENEGSEQETTATTSAAATSAATETGQTSSEELDAGTSAGEAGVPESGTIVDNQDENFNENPGGEANGEPGGTGEEPGSGEIVPSHNIEDYTFALSQSKFFYDGQPHIPDVVCNDLIEGVDYYVDHDYEIVQREVEQYNEQDGEWYISYEEAEQDPTSVGTYKVYICGMGDYTGSVELTYSIVATSITLNKTAATLYRTGTLQLKATVNNPNGKTTYTSSNTKVATVTSAGKITAKAKGTATITAKNGFAKKTVKITVKNPSLNMSKATIYLKGSKVLKVTGKVGTAYFKSSNSKVATVSSGGKITAKKAGTCTISVKSNGITLKCTVTVKKPYLSPKSVSLVKGKTKQLKIIGKVGTAKFKSSNKRIATVSAKGVIKAKKKGKCTITVKSNGVTLKCKVTVKNPPPVYVYTTRTGKRYHCDYYCWGLRNANAIYKSTLSKAKKRGLTPCHVCY